jgi:hypothetical protein
MTSGRIFFLIVGSAFVALFAAVLPPATLKPATQSWHLFVCHGRDCPPGWPNTVVTHANSNTAKLRHEYKFHST